MQKRTYLPPTLDDLTPLIVLFLYVDSTKREVGETTNKDKGGKIRGKKQQKTSHHECPAK